MIALKKQKLIVRGSFDSIFSY